MSEMHRTVYCAWIPKRAAGSVPSGYELWVDFSRIEEEECLKICPQCSVQAPLRATRDSNLVKKKISIQQSDEVRSLFSDLGFGNEHRGSCGPIQPPTSLGQSAVSSDGSWPLAPTWTSFP